MLTKREVRNFAPTHCSNFFLSFSTLPNVLHLFPPRLISSRNLAINVRIFRAFFRLLSTVRGRGEGGKRTGVNMDQGSMRNPCKWCRFHLLGGRGAGGPPGLSEDPTDVLMTCARPRCPSTFKGAANQSGSERTVISCSKASCPSRDQPELCQTVPLSLANTWSKLSRRDRCFARGWSKESD